MTVSAYAQKVLLLSAPAIGIALDVMRLQKESHRLRFAVGDAAEVAGFDVVLVYEIAVRGLATLLC